MGDLFELMGTSIDAAARTVERVAVGHQPWTSQSNRAIENIGSLRRARNNTPATEELVRRDSVLSKVESLDLSILECTSHGDLHCANIFADDITGPTLIDFGDVGTAPSAIDPVTLELSLFFNPNGPLHGDAAPDMDLNHWDDADRFASNSIYGPFVRACRAWAADVSDPVTFAVVGYLHAMRQLKYGDIPQGVPLAIARSAATALLGLVAS